ncbi:MAG: hypothetical protein VB030_10485 [Eubacterium aggregans]|uniref:hypothetical protein n=2 Tax=Eubacterium aggregans TaxID=81409 RepID=UPI002B2038CF|nr:hypothetical protein [Eubacterium aggregans]MEA5074589.1 hypothetical protein [Eubacterium aggregans]
MKKRIMIIFAVVLLLLLSITAFMLLKPTGTEEENHVEVHVEGSSIVYNGPMAAEGVEQAKQLYSPNINRLVLNSPGGEINIGMDLGEWVYNHGLDVEIKNTAFSSAANYVFTAGRNKYLHKDSIVGWHGGVTQDNDNFFMKLLMKNYLEEGQTREKSFFEKIGVDQQSTIYGQRSEYDRYSEKQNYVGWTYSLDAMEQLGIKNIQLMDGEWTPAQEFNGKKIFTVYQIKP